MQIDSFFISLEYVKENDDKAMECFIQKIVILIHLKNYLNKFYL